jgi:hypothetical protein
VRERDKLEGKELICKGREMTCYCGSGGAGVEVPLAEDEARGHAGQRREGGEGGEGGRSVLSAQAGCLAVQHIHSYRSGAGSRAVVDQRVGLRERRHVGAVGVTAHGENKRVCGLECRRKAARGQPARDERSRRRR